jgi:hypothetical protein
MFDQQDYSLFAPVHINYPAMLLTWRRDRSTWVEFRNRVVNEFIRTLESNVVEKLGPDFDAITPKKQFGEKDLRAIDAFTRFQVNQESLRSVARSSLYGAGEHRKEARKDIATATAMLGMTPLG